jgi:hypothetical protein
MVQTTCSGTARGPKVSIHRSANSMRRVAVLPIADSRALSRRPADGRRSETLGSRPTQADRVVAIVGRAGRSRTSISAAVVGSLTKVVVLDGHGGSVRGATLLSTVRHMYLAK